MKNAGDSASLSSGYHPPPVIDASGIEPSGDQPTPDETQAQTANGSDANAESQSTPNAPVPLPPIILPSTTGAAHPPTGRSFVQEDIYDTTEKDSSFATALASKVQGLDPLTLRPQPPAKPTDDQPILDQSTDPIPTPNKPTAAPPQSPADSAPKNPISVDNSPPKPSAQASEKNNTPPSTVKKSEPKPPPKVKAPRSGKKFNVGLAAGAMLLLLVVAGAGAGFYLQREQQDTRQEAASEEVTGTEIFRTQEEWVTFNNNWKTFIADSNNGWEEYVAYSKGDGARYRCQTPILRVADETMFGCDLNAIFVISDIETYISPQPIPPQSSNLNAALDMLITDSALLQEAGKQGDAYLTADIYNNPDKDTIQRFAELRKVRQIFEGQYEKTVDFEALAIYFHNQEEPEIGLETAQPAAKAKMDLLYERLKSGEISFEQAGEEIKADKITGDTTGVSLAEMDPVFKENAYFSVKGHKFFSRIFRDEVYDDELRSLGEGQMSTVRLCKDYKYTAAELLQAEQTGADFNPPMVDSCYIIFKVNKINLGINGANAKGPAETEVLEKYQQQSEQLL